MGKKPGKKRKGLHHCCHNSYFCVTTVHLSLCLCVALLACFILTPPLYLLECCRYDHGCPWMYIFYGNGRVSKQWSINLGQACSQLNAVWFLADSEVKKCNYCWQRIVLHCQQAVQNRKWPKAMLHHDPRSPEPSYLLMHRMSIFWRLVHNPLQHQSS